MVARLVERPRAGVDAGCLEPLRRGLVQQQMVDADAGIAFERAPPIGPEAVDALIGMQVADRIGPALVEDAAIGGFGFGREERVLLPVLGFVHIEVGGNDVEVAANDDGGIEVEKRCQMRVEPRHPLHLVIELRTGPGVAVGKIEAGDQDAADRGLDIAALLVAGIAGEPAARFVDFADAAQHRDAVPAALAVPDHIIARVADRLLGEFLLRGF